MKKSIHHSLFHSVFFSLLAGFSVFVYGDEISFPTQAELGNIFTVGEKVEIQAAIQTGTSVAWTVNDYQDKQVASGTTPVTDQKVSIIPGVDSKGYYLVKLTSKDGAAVKGSGTTSYAVIEPVDVKQMPDSKFAVMTHFDFYMPTDFLPLMSKIGISMVRDEHDWQVVEKVKGQYDFSGVTQSYMDVLKQAHVSPLIVFAFGNMLYDKQPGVAVWQLAPYSQEGDAAYGAYCAAVVKHFPEIKYVEIWNEYNGSFAAGKAAEDRPKYYTAMLKEAYTQIKAARPDVTVLGGATVKIPLPYYEKLFKEGALQYMDALDVHPYQEPEGTDENIAELVALTKKYNRGQSKPIWATEFSHFGDETPQRAASASSMVRMATLLLTQPEVQRVVWYLARDYRQEFHNLGLVHSDTDPMGKFTPVMTYPAYANIIHLLYGTHFIQREATDVRTRAYRFDSAAQSVWVCWSTFQEGNLTFVTKSPVKLINIVGGETTLTPSSGQVNLKVSGDLPVYVVAPKDAVTAVHEVPRSDQVLADSVTDFSGEQGKGGWSYLYVGNNQNGSAPYDPTKAMPMNWQPSPGDWADTWSGPGSWYVNGQDDMQPGGINGGQGWAIRRWTSETTGAIHFLAHVQRGDNGDGVGLKVFQDGKEIYSKLLPASSSTVVDLSPTVVKGTQLDFVVTPGPGTDTSYDATAVHAEVLTQSK
jgi:hypothetical protein